MAALDRLRTLPWYYQAFFFLLVSVAVLVAGEMLALSPVVAAKEKHDGLDAQLRTLRAKVNELRVVEQQYQDFKTRLEAQEEQLARLQTFVPTEKQTDDFMRLLQTSSLNAQIAIRRLASRPVVMKEFYAEMPFEMELDGPYYNLLAFFNRLGGSQRIVNAGTLRLRGITGSTKFDYLPGTTVEGQCMVTTYYTPSEAELAAAAPPEPATRGRPRGRR